MTPGNATISDRRATKGFPELNTSRATSARSESRVNENISNCTETENTCTLKHDNYNVGHFLWLHAAQDEIFCFISGPKELSLLSFQSEAEQEVCVQHTHVHRKWGSLIHTAVQLSHL